MRIAGLISGSSLDGLDIAICDFETIDKTIKWQLKSYETVPFPDSLAKSLTGIEKVSIDNLARIDFEFSSFSASAVKSVLADTGISIDYISSHGHTVSHHPEDGYSLQMGNGGTIAALSGIPCICDFRMTDIAYGGQGAPIAPIVEKYLFARNQYYLNLGGIANISVHDTDQILSYDVCPCNQILNAEARRIGKIYDENGVLASTGQINWPIVEHMSELAYFHQSAPKSLDNSWVMEKFYPILKEAEMSPADASATMVAFIVQQITNCVADHDTQKSMFISGGGAHHSYLIQQLATVLERKNVQIVKPEEVIIDMKEAILMALMGYLRISEIENTIASVTGAHKGTCSGAIYLP